MCRRPPRRHFRNSCGRDTSPSSEKRSAASPLAKPRTLAQSSPMRRLFLIRHAKAEPNVGRGDYERRLTGRGRDDAKRVAAALAARRVLPDIPIHSGAARAKQTAEIFAAAWRGKVELEEDAGLYDAILATLLAHTRAPSPTSINASGLVGHNPGLGELAMALTAGAEPDVRRLAAKYPTGAVAVLDFADQALGGGRAQFGGAGALPDAGGTRGRRGLARSASGRARAPATRAPTGVRTECVESKDARLCSELAITQNQDLY